MKNSFGNNIALTIFGESHGEYIGAVLDGVPAGIKIDEDFISAQLTKRRPYGKISTGRAEKDEFIIGSGVYGGFTSGTPISILIKNKDIKSSDYDNLFLMPRPSHSDYSLYCKYGEKGILPGGGHSSGRITAPIVAAGAIAIKILENKGITVATHIKQIGDICDRDFKDITEDIKILNEAEFAVLDNEKAILMKEKIGAVADEGDSIGGILETVVNGVPAGLGEPWFDSLEGVLSHALFSIPAVKGVEFGAGFNVAAMQGSIANDGFYYDGKTVKTKTNNSGGILGGISNGEPIIFRTAFKPTPTISKPQNTVDLKNGKNSVIEAKGRHDPCVVHRARVVADSITAITILDMLSQKYGRDGLV